jgi:Cu-Zn family superoxide dismutase
MDTIIVILIMFIFIKIYFSKNTTKKPIVKTTTKPIIAIANINNMNGIKGNIMFIQNNKIDKNVLIEIDLTGLPKNSELGFHIHEAGDVTDMCKSACAHFNPYKTVHGGPTSKTRHVGDLGNIISDSNGNCKMKLIDHMIKLDNSIANIIGRSIVIHSKKDDFGLGKNKESLITGNAGSRIACSIIGYSKKMFKN